MLTAELLYLVLYWFFSTEYHNSGQNIIILFLILGKSLWGVHKSEIAFSVLYVHVGDEF